MPYRLEGNCVQVNKDGKWQNLKCHDSSIKARKHLVALKINVESKEKYVSQKRSS
jgi:hypothetical protein